MRYVDEKDIGALPGKRIEPHETFRFRCHEGLECFGRCCRNLNLFLNPYDVLRIKNHLLISSDEFVSEYTSVVLRKGEAFPDVLLNMAENKEKTCPFLGDRGCSIYPDRPDTCRTVPLEMGELFDAKDKKSTIIYLFRPPSFCLGQYEDVSWTPARWAADQEAEKYHAMTRKWAEVRRLFHRDTFGTEGLSGRKAKMVFMAAYNLDMFKKFLFESSFFKRFRVDPRLKARIRKDETRLLEFAFEWIKLSLFGLPSRLIKPR